jgi:hypothetical protein
MKQYLDLMRRVLARGETRRDRTGVGTKSLFGESLRFDLRAGFPAGDHEEAGVSADDRGDDVLPESIRQPEAVPLGRVYGVGWEWGGRRLEMPHGASGGSRPDLRRAMAAVAGT